MLKKMLTDKKMNKFYVIANESYKDSWVDCVWGDIKNQATIYLDNNDLKYSLLKKIKKFHFSNKINKHIWLPFKFIWDRNLVIKYHDLEESDTNILIFQSNIKFSPQYIKKLKKDKNAIIVLYLPDTIHRLGIADSCEEFNRYAEYYQIDYVYSFDSGDCNKYGFEFFDIYSKLDMISQNEEQGIFYIGNCRSKERLDILHGVYQRLKGLVKCNFNLVGVDARKQIYMNGMIYNKPMKYAEVICNMQKNTILLELVNKGQNGNTFRFKEAVCYNKRLLTNNPEVMKSIYYNKEYIQYFDNVENIDIEWLKCVGDIDYKYKGEYSPLHLLELIEKKINI